MNNDGTPFQSVFNGPMGLVWVAAGIAILFLGFLVLDLVRRRKRGRRFRGEPEGLWSRLTKPLRAIRELRGALKEQSRQRSRRRELEEQAARKMRK